MTEIHACWHRLGAGVCCRHRAPGRSASVNKPGNVALYFRRKYFAGEAQEPTCEIEKVKAQECLAGGSRVVKSIVLTLSEEELFELERIMLDDESSAALRFLKAHFGKPVRAAISGEGH